MKHIRNIIFILIAWPFPALTALAPPETPFNTIASLPLEIFDAKPINQKPFNYLSLGDFEIHIEKTSLAAIVQNVEKGEISHQGDAADSIYWLCYTGSKERIWIISHGEMGGNNHYVTSIAAESIMDKQPRDDCPTLTEKHLPILLDSKLWLGASREAVINALGEPSVHEKGWITYNYNGILPGNCPPNGFGVNNWLIFKVENGIVQSIHAGQVTSC